MKYLKAYKLFESFKDIEQNIKDILASAIDEGLDVYVGDFKFEGQKFNHYIEIEIYNKGEKFNYQSFIDDMYRVKRYLEGIGYQRDLEAGEWFKEEGNNKTRLINMMYRKESSPYDKTNESHIDNVKDIRQDIKDIMFDIEDNPLFDVEVELYDYSLTSATGLNTRWYQYSSKRPQNRTQYNAGLRVTVHRKKFDTGDNSKQESNLVKGDLERVLEYLESQGVEIVSKEYKYSNNYGDTRLPYTSDDYPRYGWMSVRISALLWIK